jgi:hypothetical protein
MELLNSIAFHAEDPTQFIERIDALITETDSDYKSKSAVYTSNVAALQTQLSEIDTTKALTSERVAFYNNAITNATSELQVASKKQQEREVQLAMMVSLEQQLTVKENQYRALLAKQASSPAYLSDTALLNLSDHFSNTSLERDASNLIPRIESDIRNVELILPSLMHRDNLQKELLAGREQVRAYEVNTLENYTENDYLAAQKQGTVYQDNLNIAKSLNVVYDNEAIQTLITRLNTLLQNQEYLKYKRDSDNIQQKLSMLRVEREKPLQPLVYPDMTVNTVAPCNTAAINAANASCRQKLTEMMDLQGNLTAQIAHLTRECDVLRCPKCNSGLRYQNGNLVSSDVRATLPAELAALREQSQQVSIGIQAEQRNAM